MADKCNAVTKSGFPCTAPPVEGSDFCVFHGETPEETRHALRVLGGQNSRRSAWIKQAGQVNLDIESIMALVEETITNIRAMSSTPAAANSMIGVIRELVDLYELTALADKVASLEELFGVYKQGGGNVR